MQNPWSSKKKIKREDLLDRVTKLQTFAFTNDEEQQNLAIKADHLKQDMKKTRQYTVNQDLALQNRAHYLEEFCMGLGFDLAGRNGSVLMQDNVLRELDTLRQDVNEVESYEENMEGYMKMHGYNPGRSEYD